MITLNDILQDSRFSYLKILSYDNRFNRVVQTIDSTETPDVEMYLKPKTLLLTTGMIYQDNQEQLISLLSRLNKADCSGLLIKLGRFVSEIDDSVIKVAESINFPIIKIPMDKTLGEVHNQLLSFIWDNQNEQLTYAFNIQKKFHSLLIQGANTKDILESLGMMFKIDVALLNPFHQLVAYSKQLLYHYNETDLVNLVASESIDNAFASLIVDSHGQTHNVVVELVKLNNSYPYYLFVMDPERLAYPVSSLAIDQVILLISYILNQDMNLTYHLMNDKEKFFENIISNSEVDNKLILSLSDTYGIAKAAHYQVVTMRTTVMKHSVVDTMEWYTLIYNQIINILKNYKTVTVFPKRSNASFHFVFQGTKTKFMVSLLKEIHEHIYNYMNLYFVFGIGSTVQYIDAIPLSYRESMYALDHGTLSKDCDYFYHFSSLNFETLAHSLDTQQRHDYCRYILMDLIEEKHTELRETLTVWLDTNLDYSQSATRLFIHKNTVRYRIDKCKDILSNDFSDSTSLFEISFALKLFQLE